MKPYIYQSQKNKEFSGSEAIIVLPDIYCQTDYAKKTVEHFAEAFKKQVFLLDYFYIETGEANSLGESDKEKAQGLMKNLKGDDFAVFFKKALSEIKEAYPNISQFAVVGFCFGGRLAYIAGGEKEVSKVISFYGGGAHTPNYVEGKTPVEYLISKRKGDAVSVQAFFGTEDSSILENDREKTKQEFAKAGMNYESHEYKAGHAYFQEGRKNYDASASQASWEVLKNIFNG